MAECVGFDFRALDAYHPKHQNTCFMGNDENPVEQIGFSGKPLSEYCNGIVIRDTDCR
jgi:hypothetical protein